VSRRTDLLADLLALATAVVVENTDPDAMRSTAVSDILGDLLHVTGLDVARPAGHLIAILARELGERTGELPEEILRRFALAAAMSGEGDTP
jgi:hypothetical protein